VKRTRRGQMVLAAHPELASSQGFISILRRSSLPQNLFALLAVVVVTGPHR